MNIPAILQTDLVSSAIDSARCTHCNTIVEFDIHHLTGVTMQRCACAKGWRPVMRREPAAIDAPTPTVRAARLDRAERRRRVLEALPRLEARAATIFEVADTSGVCVCTARDDLLHLISTSRARRKSVRNMESTRGGYFKHVFWRVA